MITGLHVLLKYTCDHCFLSCSPERTGVFTLERLSREMIFSTAGIPMKPRDRWLLR